MPFSKSFNRGGGQLIWIPKCIVLPLHWYTLFCPYPLPIPSLRRFVLSTTYFPDRRLTHLHHQTTQSQGTMIDQRIPSQRTSSLSLFCLHSKLESTLPVKSTNRFFVICSEETLSTRPKSACDGVPRPSSPLVRCESSQFLSLKPFTLTSPYFRYFWTVPSYK